MLLHNRVSTPPFAIRLPIVNINHVNVVDRNRLIPVFLPINNLNNSVSWSKAAQFNYAHDSGINEISEIQQKAPNNQHIKIPLF